jgi:hypothetical protein
LGYYQPHTTYPKNELTSHDYYFSYETPFLPAYD